MNTLYENIVKNLKINEKFYILFVLIFKLFIGLYYFSSPAENWYIPFMEKITYSLIENFDSPFSYKVSSNIAFPYGSLYLPQFVLTLIKLFLSR